MTTLRLTVGVLAATLAAASPVPAQVTIDATKITCNQWLAYKIADPDHIAIWLSGYFNGKRDNTLLDVQGFKANVARLKEFCFQNPDTTLMQAVEKHMSAAK